MSVLDKMILSWTVDIETGTNEVSVKVNGVAESLTLTPGTYDGVSFASSGMLAGSNSLAKAFATMLATHSEISLVSVSYDFDPTTGTGHPATVYTIRPVTAIIAGDEIDWTLGTLNGSLFGWTGLIPAPLTPVVAPSLSDTETLQNSAGYWSPVTGTDNVFDVRDLEVVGSQSVAASANTEAAFSTRVLSTVINGSLIYDVVDDAFIRAYRAEDPLGAFVSNAKRTEGDLHNLLERLMIAGANNRTISVLRENTATPYYIFKLSPPWNIGGMTTQVGNSGSRYSVVLNLKVVE